LRLANQRLALPRSSPGGVGSPAEVVRWMGAVQAQDYAGGLWAVGLRLPRATEVDVEAAIAARAVVRTWPMRGTLHLVPAEDAAWMVALLAPRMVARSAGRYRQLGLEESDFRRARKALERALGGGRSLTREEAYATLDRGGVSPEGQRGIHVLGHLAQLGVLCGGPRRGRQPTFVLLAEWVPEPRRPAEEEQLATLATRFFRGHGPATLQDFAWWTGLPARAARRAIAAAGEAVREERRGDVVRWAAEAAPPPRGTTVALLPAWDEYLVAYRDRGPALGHLGARGGGALLSLVGRPTVVVDGRVCGAWRRERRAGGVRIEAELWEPLATAARTRLAEAAERYGHFVGHAVALETREAAGAP
jgi:hypothetical protein